ncbi:MAG TPA: adenylyltransferase/cytidyltransferase family protein [Candidatus Nanopelagicales bacterium]|nr:adenylyltransferase/cytidyltransferase family protein [Candidatus Nanopelagicales bacterium]
MIGYAPGVFDLFHIGHLNLLRRASLGCDYLVAGVVTDDIVLQDKGKRPVVPEQERLEIVRAIRFVDEVHLEDTTDKVLTWSSVGFHRMFKGDDWLGSAKFIQAEADLAPMGVAVIFVPYTGHVSTTHLRRTIGELNRAATTATARDGRAPVSAATEI